MNTRPTPWRAPLLLRASLALHVIAAAALLLVPRQWPWILGLVLVDQLLLTAAGLWPRSSSLGTNWTRLPAPAAARGEVCITIDDGPDPEVTPAVLEILDAHAAKATFFCIGERVQRHPDLARACISRGHSLENHSQQHAHGFALFGPRRLERDLRLAQRVIAGACGTAPMFFRAPAGLRSVLLDRVLHRVGLTLVSWSRRGFDTVDADPAAVLSRLTRDLGAGDILLLHDGHAARTQDGTPVILEVLPALLRAMKERGLRPVTLREGAR